MTGVWYRDLDLDMVTGLWNTHVPNFGSILILKMQRTSISFKSSFGDFDEAGVPWLGFGILLLIWIWSLVFDTPMSCTLAVYIDFEGATNICFLNVLIGALKDAWV